MPKEQIVLLNDIRELEKMALKLELISEEWQIPMPITLNLNLVLEELVTNIIFYGYDDKAEHKITIDMSLENNTIEIRLSDDGREFNPLLLPEPDLTAPIEERKIGGLGIFFVRKIMDDITYRRENDQNILTLIKNIA